MPPVTSRFTADLLAANRIDPGDFLGWVFAPGMRFGSPDKWWGDLGLRDFPHEGVDLCLFRHRSGEVRRLGAGARIPAVFAGRVRAVFRDYLGHAVVVEHDDASGGGKGIAVYAHTAPREGLAPGTALAAGETLAAVADTSRSKARILPHLHLSLGRPSPDVDYRDFVWNRMRDPGQVTLIDPEGLLDPPFETVPPPGPAAGG